MEHVYKPPRSEPCTRPYRYPHRRPSYGPSVSHCDNLSQEGACGKKLTIRDCFKGGSRNPRRPGKGHDLRVAALQYGDYRQSRHQRRDAGPHRSTPRRGSQTNGMHLEDAGVAGVQGNRLLIISSTAISGSGLSSRDGWAFELCSSLKAPSKNLSRASPGPLEAPGRIRADVDLDSGSEPFARNVVACVDAATIQFPEPAFSFLSGVGGSDTKIRATALLKRTKNVMMEWNKSISWELYPRISLSKKGGQLLSFNRGSAGVSVEVARGYLIDE
jgi:hypothetical protein